MADQDEVWERIVRDGWRLVRDRSQDPSRAPGPIDLNRYVTQPAYSGIQTFNKLPICLTPEDLRAGQVDVAICGVPIDTSIGQRGAAWGPSAIRGGERALPSPPFGRPHQHVGIDPFEVLTVVDYGDAAVHPLSIEESHEPVRTFVREIVEAGAMPMILGGDHSIMWPDVAALADIYGPGRVGVLHFDAHADCSEMLFGHLHSHGTPIRRLIDDEHVPGRNFIQIGLRGYYPDAHTREWMTDQGMRSHFMVEIEEEGLEAVLQRAVAEALDGPEFLYISLDIDVLDPAFAPGTGTPEPAGLSTRELFPMLRRLCHETEVVGAEVVEVSPTNDPGYTTALNAHRSVMEMLTGIAMRKANVPRSIRP